MKKAKQQHKHVFVPKDLLAKYTRLLDEARARVHRNINNKCIDILVEEYIRKHEAVHRVLQYVHTQR
jgi:hypothetical protein